MRAGVRLNAKRLIHADTRSNSSKALSQTQQNLAEEKARADRLAAKLRALGIDSELS